MTADEERAVAVVRQAFEGTMWPVDTGALLDHLARVAVAALAARTPQTSGARPTDAAVEPRYARLHAIPIIEAELAETHPATLDSAERRRAAIAAVNALADHPAVLAALAERARGVTEAQAGEPS